MFKRGRLDMPFTLEAVQRHHEVPIQSWLDTRIRGKPKCKSAREGTMPQLIRRSSPVEGYGSSIGVEDDWIDEAKAYAKTGDFC